MPKLSLFLILMFSMTAFAGGVTGGAGGGGGSSGETVSLFLTKTGNLSEFCQNAYACEIYIQVNEKTLMQTKVELGLKIEEEIPSSKVTEVLERLKQD